MQKLITTDGGSNSGESTVAPSRGIGEIRRIGYMVSVEGFSEFMIYLNFKLITQDDIPDDYRLMTCDEFEKHTDEALQHMDAWAICLLTDGKCDGRGYGAVATRLSRAEREGANRTHMGEMLITHDGPNTALSSFSDQVWNLYNSVIAGSDDSAVVNNYLIHSSNYRPSIFVSSCPGDLHGGVHTRMMNLCQQYGWKFAPVQYSDPEKARDWKRFWKIQVEEFACDAVSEAGRRFGTVEILELKISGGGAGCETERSRNMTHWWIDWVKRLGADIYEDIKSYSARGSSVYCPAGCVQVQIGQAVVEESDITRFPKADGNQLSPQVTNSVEFELHTLVIDGQRCLWHMVTDVYASQGPGKWTRVASNTFRNSGAF
jgi:hypothetical protein